MGAAFLARDTRLDRPVASKLLKIDGASSLHKLRFVKEAKAASALNHPIIVTIYEFGSADRTDFIAMPKVIDYARQTADALAAAQLRSRRLSIPKLKSARLTKFLAANRRFAIA